MSQALVPNSKGKVRQKGQARPPYDATDAAKNKLDAWINPQTLPRDEGFRFSHPNRMSPEDNIILASWIIKGELGLIPEEKRFRWVNQVHTLTLPHPSDKTVPETE